MTIFNRFLEFLTITFVILRTVEAPLSDERLAFSEHVRSTLDALFAVSVQLLLSASLRRHAGLQALVSVAFLDLKFLS